MDARWILVGIAGLVCAAIGLAPLGREPASVTFAPPLEQSSLKFSDESAASAFRERALGRAKVWRQTDPSTVDLGSNPPDPTGTLSEPVVRCKFLPVAAEGTTPQFRCVLPDGEVVKVKYGDHIREIQAELAASRLLTALGFGADSMFLVPRLRCHGCPTFPFEVIWTLDHIGAREMLAERLPDDRYSEFTWVAVERRFPGLEISAGDREGWAWYELDQASREGASRAELDALRLMAVFLSHWDNKAENQRLVCLSPLPRNSRRCDQSFALMHDLGATFGPNKISLEHWHATPVWTDKAHCTVSMRTLPYDGGTFKDATISEPGRALLARQLQALSDEQITALFSGARFPESRGLFGLRADTIAWADAFKSKVRQIADAGPCPAL